MTSLLMSSSPIRISTRLFRCRYSNSRDVVASCPSFSRRTWWRASHLHEKEAKVKENESKGVQFPAADSPHKIYRGGLSAVARHKSKISAFACHRNTRLGASTLAAPSQIPEVHLFCWPVLKQKMNLEYCPILIHWLCLKYENTVKELISLTHPFHKTCCSLPTL